MVPTLCIKFDCLTIELYMLNRGAHFPNFGGSRHPLVVEKTASMIVRTISHTIDRVFDVEYDIDNKVIWSWIRDLINRGPDVVASS